MLNDIPVAPVIKTSESLIVPVGIAGFEIDGIISFTDLPAGWTQEKNGDKTILYSQGAENTTVTLSYIGIIDALYAVDQIGREVQVVQTTSIDNEASEGTCMVFPNPALDYGILTYTLPDNVTATIQIVDTEGRVFWTEQVQTSGQVSIDVSTWTAGAYFVRLINSTQTTICPWFKVE